MLSCLNFPTELRLKDQNIIMHGLIPGPRQPPSKGAGINSFLRPLVDDFLELQRAIPHVYNAHLKTHTTLKAHLCLVGADMVARKSLMMTMGHRAKSYCEYCNITGLVKGVARPQGLYCPWHAPRINLPPEIQPREMELCRRRLPYFPFGENGDLSRHPLFLYLRRDERFREIAARCEITANGDLGRLFGISGISLLSELSSIVYP